MNKQSAYERPTPTHYRMASIASGRAKDYAGSVHVEKIDNFDLDRTIFKTLEGTLARAVVSARVAKEAVWNRGAAEAVESSYNELVESNPLPDIDPAVLDFMANECDFDVEHADGSFLDHLYFCFEYSAHHYPERSPLVMLLHSILGTGTNTFAMEADKIPALRDLLDDFDWIHVEAFPSILRLLYDFGLRRELRARSSRPDDLESIEFHRVLDNERVTMSGDELWTQLNFQLIHLIDFLPVANWANHQNDTSFILFRDLYELLSACGKLEARIDYQPSSGRRSLRGEPKSLTSFLSSLIPTSVGEKMAARSVRTFSERIGHSLDFRLVWK